MCSILALTRLRENNLKMQSRALSYVNATFDLNGLEVIHDVFYLLEDLAKGVIPFDTDTQVNGVLGLFFFFKFEGE